MLGGPEKSNKKTDMQIFYKKINVKNVSPFPIYFTVQTLEFWEREKKSEVWEKNSQLAFFSWHKLHEIKIYPEN